MTFVRSFWEISACARSAANFEASFSIRSSFCARKNSHHFYRILTRWPPPMNPVICCQLFDEAWDFKKQISTMFVITILQIVVRFVNLLRFKSRKKVYINQKTGDLPPHHKKRNRPYCWASTACEITVQNSQAFIFPSLAAPVAGTFPLNPSVPQKAWWVTKWVIYKKRTARNHWFQAVFPWCRWRWSNPHAVARNGFWVRLVCQFQHTGICVVDSFLL